MPALSALFNLLLAANSPPSLAVLPLDVRTGVADSSALLMGETLVEQLRATHAFSRVVSIQEVKALLSMEAQRQLAQCDSDSCLLEIAGSLGVDLVLLGSVGILGHSGIFNARLIRMKTAQVVASVSLQACGGTEEALLHLMRPTAQELVHGAGLSTQRASATQCNGTPAAPIANRRPLILRVFSVVTALPAATALVAAPAAWAAASAWLLALGNHDVVAAVPTLGTQRTTRYLELVLPSVAGAVMGGVLLLAGAMGVLTAAGLLAASTVG